MVLDLSVAFDDLANGVGGLPSGLQMVNDAFVSCLGDDQNHAQTQVEGATHLFRLHLSSLLDEAKHGKHFPAVGLNSRGKPRRQDASQVFGNPVP